MASRELPKLRSYFDATEKSSIHQVKKKAQHHKTISSENLIEKPAISNPRVFDKYGDGYVSSIQGGNRRAILGS
jgi:hypothetical protein